MKKLYEKNALAFALVWIGIYCLVQSLANPLNELIGIPYIASALFCLLQAISLFHFIYKNGLMERCGLPLTPADLKLTGEDTMNAFLGSRDIRDKYLTSNILWDLGLFEETAVKLKEMNA